MSDIVEDAKAWLAGRDNKTLRTHSDNCHQWHAECLVARLIAEIERHRMTPERWAPVSDDSPDVGVSVVGWAGYPIIVKRVLVDGGHCWELENEEIGQDGWITHFIPIEPFPQFPWC